jgi:FAD/FMN-containing dehydrogenase
VRWVNWTGDQRCAPAAIVRPASEAELVAAVRDAVVRGHGVRAAGSGHSFTDIACTDGVLVDIGRMQRVLEHDGDRVTVEAGITLRRLGRELAARGLALENQGDIDAQTLAGATATGTHGTGVRFRNLSAGVAGLRLVTASGETLDRLDEIVDGSDHFEFWVFPYTRVALTRTCRRSTEDPSPSPAWRRRLQEDAIENGLLDLICRAGRAAPRGVPRLNRLVTAAMSANEVEDHSHRVYATRRRVRFNEMEYAISRAHAREAVERALAAIERRRLPVGFPLEVRFAAADDALLSTAHERESCYVAVHQYRGMEFESAFRAVEEVMDSYGGRPHWGKRHYQTAATLAPRYAGWDRFAAVRARLDPGGTFANAYVRRCLG